MTPSELKKKYYEHNPDGHFFDRKTMQFFGDTMKNFGCFRDTLDGKEVFILYRKRQPRKDISTVRFVFDAKTFESRVG